MKMKAFLRIPLLMSRSICARCFQSFTFSLSYGLSKQRRISPFSAVASTKSIFCNRELTLSKIEAVGFDMDFTLVRYTAEFDLLTFQSTKEKLLMMGYPPEVAAFEYYPESLARGLVLDKEKGNIVKLDRHDYVNVARHGSKLLSKKQRHQAYRDLIDVQPSFGDSNYLNLDTQFHLIDAALFAQLVDLKDSGAPHLIEKSYAQLAVDIRSCVDICHKDGVIKNAVMENPNKFIEADPYLFSILRKLRRANKKIFLLTNSLYDFSDAVMSHLFDQYQCHNQMKGNDEDTIANWEDYFDVIVVGASKPEFIQTTGNRQIFRVIGRGPIKYCLQNCEELYSLPSESPTEKTLRVRTFLENGKVFQGGDWKHLHEFLEIDSGEKLLYVGDHMYSDVVKGKRRLGWRTCLLIPELEHTLNIDKLEVTQSCWEKVRQLRSRQTLLDQQVDELSTELYRSDETGQQKDTAMIQHRRTLVNQQVALREELSAAIAHYHSLFNPTWGHMFKAGMVSDYACIYTTHANAVGAVSLKRAFTPAFDDMPHELNA